MCILLTGHNIVSLVIIVLSVVSFKDGDTYDGIQYLYSLLIIVL